MNKKMETIISVCVLILLILLVYKTILKIETLQKDIKLNEKENQLVDIKIENAKSKNGVIKKEIKLAEKNWNLSEAFDALSHAFGDLNDKHEDLIKAHNSVIDQLSKPNKK